MQGRLAEGGARSTENPARSPEATAPAPPLGEGGVQPPGTRTQDAATAGAAEPGTPYGESAAYTSDMFVDPEEGALLARAEGGQGDGDAGAPAETKPGFFSNVAAAFAAMGPMDYVRLGIGLVVLALILVGAAIAWRVAYSPKPQRKHTNGKHAQQSP